MNLNELDRAYKLVADELEKRRNGKQHWTGDLSTSALSAATAVSALKRGLSWLCRAVNEGRHEQSAPIGLYFDKLWYAESLYPLVFATSALHRGKRFPERIERKNCG